MVCWVCVPCFEARQAHAVPSNCGANLQGTACTQGRVSTQFHCAADAMAQVGIEMKFKDAKYPVIIAPTHVPELNEVSTPMFLHVIPLNYSRARAHARALDRWCRLLWLLCSCCSNPDPQHTMPLVTPCPHTSLQITVTDAGVEVGGAVTLTRLSAFLKRLIAERPAWQTATFRAVVEQLR